MFGDKRQPRAFVRIRHAVFSDGKIFPPTPAQASVAPMHPPTSTLCTRPLTAKVVDGIPRCVHHMAEVPKTLTICISGDKLFLSMPTISLRCHLGDGYLGISSQPPLSRWIYWATPWQGSDGCACRMWNAEVEMGMGMGMEMEMETVAQSARMNG